MADLLYLLAAFASISAAAATVIRMLTGLTKQCERERARERDEIEAAYRRGPVNTSDGLMFSQVGRAHETPRLFGVFMLVQCTYFFICWLWA